MDLGAGFTFYRVHDGPAGSLARRYSRHGERRALHLPRVHRSEDRVADGAGACEHRFRVGSRFVDSRGVVQEAHAGAVLRRRVPARDHAGARLREGAVRSDPELGRHQDARGQRALPLREVGAGRAHGIDLRYRQLPRSRQARSHSDRARDPADGRDANSHRPVGFRGRVPRRSGERPGQQQGRAAADRAEPHLRVHGHEPVRPEGAEKRAPHLQRCPRASCAVDGGRS